MLSAECLDCDERGRVGVNFVTIKCGVICGQLLKKNRKTANELERRVSKIFEKKTNNERVKGL